MIRSARCSPQGLAGGVGGGDAESGPNPGPSRADRCRAEIRRVLWPQSNIKAT